jgi:BlaI family penicillinase repressor
MPRKPSTALTDAELRVMNVLWDKGEATVRDVTDALARKYDLAYTTVLTVLQVLKQKKYVAAKEAGRAHIFRPLVSRADARAKALEQVVGSFFGGSSEALAQHLIENDDIDLARLRALEKRLKHE